MSASFDIEQTVIYDNIVIKQYRPIRRRVKKLAPPVFSRLQDWTGVQ
jgi:hypothetical protein